MDDLADLDATALAALVRKKEVSPLELVDATIARIEAGNERLNAVVWKRYDEARRHLERALRTAARILGNAADAEEIAQEAMLRVFTRAHSWRPGRAKFTTWLYQIVVNLAVDLRRRPSMERLDWIDAAVDPGPLAGTALEERQRQRAVREAIEQMPVRQRAALTLCYYEGLSGEEAARALSTSLKGVEGLLLRARRFLKQRLRSQGL